MEDIMIKTDTNGSIRLTLSPFLKTVLVIIAIALSVIAVRGFFAVPKPLYAESNQEIDVNIKSIGGWSASGSLPIKIEEFPYSSQVKVKVVD
jgi:hypothetical protein